MAVRAAEQCPDENLLVSLIEGRLDEADVRALEHHLDVCLSCDSLFGELAAVISPSPDLSTRPKGDLKIGRYRVIGEVGSGAMGVVYAAHDPDLDRKVALKLLRPDLAVSAYHAAARARLLREARLLAGLNHPNVLSVYEAGVAGDQVFIAVELIEGRALDAWQETGHPWRKVVEIYVQAGRGLAAAHREGLVHRDVKPANLMVGDDGRVRVTDFGLATARDSETSGLRPSSRADTALKTQSGAIVGTPAYMAPEQLAARRVDARSDQFSFAVALGEALVGERPIAGATVEDLEEARMSAGRDEVPRELLEVVARGLRARAADRFADMEALVRELERILAAGADTAASVPPGPLVAQTVPPAPLPARTTPPAAPPAEAGSAITPQVVATSSGRRLAYGAVALAALAGAWLFGRSSVVRPAETARSTAAEDGSSEALAQHAVASGASPSPSTSGAPVDPSAAITSVASAVAPPRDATVAPPSAAASAPAGAAHAAASAPSSATVVPASITDDERSMVIGIERAHDGGEGADCLKRLAELRRANPALAARADLALAEAQCTQMAGDCAAGRTKLTARLAPSYAGSALDAAVDGASIAKCRRSPPADTSSPEFQARRDALQKLMTDASAARAAKDVEKCRSVGVEAQALAARDGLGSDPRLKPLALGVTTSVAMCLADAGDAGSCATARAQWRAQYRTLYPELVANGIDDAALDKMFHESFPKCP